MDINTSAQTLRECMVAARDACFPRVDRREPEFYYRRPGPETNANFRRRMYALSSKPEQLWAEISNKKKKVSIACTENPLLAVEELARKFAYEIDENATGEERELDEFICGLDHDIESEGDQTRMEIPTVVPTYTRGVKLGKSSGVDGVEPGLFKFLAPGLAAESIQKLVDSAINDGIIPVSWQVGRICPIPKGSDGAARRPVQIQNAGDAISQAVAVDAAYSVLRHTFLPFHFAYLPHICGGDGQRKIGRGVRTGSAGKKTHSTPYDRLQKLFRPYF